MRKAGLLAVGLLWLTAALPLPAAAAQGITVSPPFQRIVLAPGQPSIAFSFTVTNNTQAAQSFSVLSRDFGALDESGGVAFLGSDIQDINNPYRLAPFITTDQQSLALAPGQSQDIKVTITDDHSLAAGGHYAAVLLTSTTGASGPQVTVRPAVSTLIFLRKAGDDKSDMTVTDHQATSGEVPSTIKLRFRNDGNIDLTPHGTVSLTDLSGRTVAQGVINENAAIVLPGSKRVITVQLTKLSDLAPLGYKLIAHYSYEGLPQPKTYTASVTTPITGGQLFFVIFVLALAAIGFWFRRQHRPTKARK